MSDFILNRRDGFGAKLGLVLFEFVNKEIANNRIFNAIYNHSSISVVGEYAHNAHKGGVGIFQKRQDDITQDVLQPWAPGDFAENLLHNADHPRGNDVLLLRINIF